MSVAQPTAGVKDATTNVWSAAKINEWVQTEHTGMQWSAFKQNHLMNAEDRTAYATGLVTKIVNAWEDKIVDMPSVCEEGLKCRERIFNALMVEINGNWDNMLRVIDENLEAGESSSKKILQDAWKEAYDCEDGCECEEIDIVYQKVIETQRSIVGQIETLKGTLTTLIEEEDEILEFCPEYADVEGEYVYQVPDVPEENPAAGEFDTAE